ncbi:hypothetical protein [Actinomadura sp. HBU206391]|uniref:hypothetical protein n=1 Tax=Actinomadura sp. HBU206391 TaxID=2731692 RepID=UPI00164EE5D3|nr:hypothetical protein [Actinomadura sp. HBU206391]MBC6459218.1 hypothetical protein [Actinomadura sp. HBU206391]
MILIDAGLPRPVAIADVFDPSGVWKTYATPSPSAGRSSGVGRQAEAERHSVSANAPPWSGRMVRSPTLDEAVAGSCDQVTVSATVGDSRAARIAG